MRRCAVASGIILALGAILLYTGMSLQQLQTVTAHPFDLTSTAAAYLPLVAKPEDTPAPTGTSTPTHTPTASPTTPPASSAFFAVGPGGSDVIPHQIVRTGSDRVYIFVSIQYSTTIRAYWTTSAGLPNSATDFGGAALLATGANPISLDAVYDGGNTIHVLANAQDGMLKDYPFDVASNTFRPAIALASDTHTVPGVYIGSSGVSGMVDKNGALHVTYWSSGNHIKHRAYTYNDSSNTLTPAGDFFQVDTAGSANHPAVAVSPLDNSVTIAWVSEANAPTGKILARSRSSGGTWSSVETVSTADVWTSSNAGINIDQGPSLVIGSDGVKHLAYMGDYISSYDYGRIYYAANSGSGWSDPNEALPAYTHDPALILNSAGELYVLGHGHPENGPLQGGGPCLDMRDLCKIKRNDNGTWGPSQRIAAHTGSTSFDASPSVKWSAAGFNRPETIEFIVFRISNGDYDHPTIFYGRF